MERTAPPAAGFVAPPETETRWLLFQCSGRGLAIELDRVREISTPVRPTRVPGCGSNVYGLVGLRGRVVTVFDFGAALGERPSSEFEHHRLLFLERGGRLIGAAVDDVLSVAVTAHEPGPLEGLRALPGLQPDEVTGTCVVAGQRFIAVDIDLLLARLLA